MDITPDKGTWLTFNKIFLSWNTGNLLNLCRRKREREREERGKKFSKMNKRFSRMDLHHDTIINYS